MLNTESYFDALKSDRDDDEEEDDEDEYEDEDGGGGGGGGGGGEQQCTVVNSLSYGTTTLCRCRIGGGRHGWARPIIN